MLRNVPAAVLFMCVAPSFAPAGLVAHFDFEEGSGTTVSSQVGSWTGSFQGDPQWVGSNLAPVPTGSSWAVEFDGDGDYIPTNYAGIAGNGARSVSAWVKLNSNGNAAIVAWGDSGNNGTKWHVRVNESTTNNPLRGLRTEIQGSFEIRDTTLADGQWYHIVSVYNGGGTFGSGQVQHYINGVLANTADTGADNVNVNTTTTSSTASSALHSVWFGGRNQTGNLGSFDGLIDEVRIYDHALTQSEVTALYAIPEPSTGLALVALIGFSFAVARRRR